MDDDEEANYFDAMYYVRHNDKYMEKIHDAFCEEVDRCKGDYLSKANECVDELEKKKINREDSDWNF